MNSTIEPLDQLNNDLLDILQNISVNTTNIIYFDLGDFYHLKGKTFTGDAIAVISYDESDLYDVMIGDLPILKATFLKQLGKMYHFEVVDDTAILIIEGLILNLISD